MKPPHRLQQNPVFVQAISVLVVELGVDAHFRGNLIDEFPRALSMYSGIVQEAFAEIFASFLGFIS